MTPEQIISMAIDQAIANGWEGGECYVQSPSTIVVTSHGVTFVLCYEQVVYARPFAKALWGESRDWKKQGLYEGLVLRHMPEWQYHLQMMVVAPDPIRYLGEHL